VSAWNDCAALDALVADMDSRYAEVLAGFEQWLAARGAFLPGDKEEK
jgi:hypothetical protein